MELVTSGQSKVSVSRNAKGEYSYEIVLYISTKGRAPEAGLARLDSMRMDLEHRLGISDEDLVPFEPVAEAVENLKETGTATKGQKSK